jgi:hypothetical protein
MQSDIGVRMAFGFECVRDRNAIDDNGVAGDQTMHIKTHAGTDIAVIMAQKARGAVKIVGIGDFHIVRVRRYDGNVDAGFFCDGGIVRQLCAGCSPVRDKDIVEVKGLRRMRLPQIGAIDRRGDGDAVGALERIDQRLGRYRAFGGVERLAHIGNRRGVDQGTGGVMDHHHVGPGFGQPFKTEMHAFLT